MHCIDRHVTEGWQWWASQAHMASLLTRQAPWPGGCRLDLQRAITGVMRVRTNCVDMLFISPAVTS